LYSLSDAFLRTAIGLPRQPITPFRAATMTMQIAVLVGAVLQDFRDGQRSALVVVESILSPAGGSTSLALVPKPILEARDLCPC
jgi:hypothetical protein